MQSAKEFALRRFPKLSRWIFPEAEVDNAAADNVGGLQGFSLGLNKRLANDAAGRSGNLVYSPLSVYAALSLVAAGARERTLDELLGVLGAPSGDALADHVRALAGQALADRSHAGGPQVSFACGVWYDRTSPLRPEYRDAATQSFKAVTRAVNFHQQPDEAAKQINAWVASSTNNLIPSIIAPGALSRLTDLVLANAIYFKGTWEEPFDKRRTKEDKFHRLNGTDVDVPFMRGFGGGGQLVACHDGFKVLQLRYEQGRPLPDQPAPIYSMCVFLPDARDGLWRLTDKIACNPEFLRKHLPTNTVPVGDFRLPRFKVSFGKDMTGVLRELGVKDAFDQRKADLSSMAEDYGGAQGRRRLALQSVIQKAVIEVNEEGTEAAAVAFEAIVGCDLRSPPPPPRVDFVADHPFAFFVIEEVSGAILFAGHVVDPSIN